MFGSESDVLLGDLDPEGFRPVIVETECGPVWMRWYEAGDARDAVLYVGAAGGGFDTPASGLYPRLCEELAEDGLGALRVRFRYSTELDEAIFDLIAGAEFLRGQGVEQFAFVGHSFGAAVALQAAVRTAETRAVVCLSTQSYGAEVAGELPAGCATLFVHGEEDRVVSPASSVRVHAIANEPKRLVLVPGAGHTLDEAAEQVHDEVAQWLLGWLKV